MWSVRFIEGRGYLYKEVQGEKIMIRKLSTKEVLKMFVKGAGYDRKENNFDLGYPASATG